MIQQFHFWVFIQRKWKNYLDRYMHPHVYCTVIYNSQHIETICVHEQINEWRCGMCIHWSTVQHKKMDGLWGDYVKWNKLDKDKYCMFSLKLKFKEKKKAKNPQIQDTEHRHREQIGGCQRLRVGIGQSGWGASKGTNFQL